MELQEVIENAPLFGQHRVPTAADDFGDMATVGLKLKISSKPFNQLGDHDFGYYLGRYKGQYHVGTHVVLSWPPIPSKLKSYDDLDLLKQEWMLD